MHPCGQKTPERCVRLALSAGHSSISHDDAREGSSSTLEDLSSTDGGHPEGVTEHAVASGGLQGALVGWRELEWHRTSMLAPPGTLSSPVPVCSTCGAEAPLTHGGATSEEAMTDVSGRVLAGPHDLVCGC
jgi:hypothetical protein